MIKQRYGRIVNLSSVSAKREEVSSAAPITLQQKQVFSVCKALAREVAAYGITVNSVAPGLVATDIRAASSHLRSRRRCRGYSLPETGTLKMWLQLLLFWHLRKQGTSPARRSTSTGFTHGLKIEVIQRISFTSSHRLKVWKSDSASANTVAAFPLVATGFQRIANPFWAELDFCYTPTVFITRLNRIHNFCP